MTPYPDRSRCLGALREVATCLLLATLVVFAFLQAAMASDRLVAQSFKVAGDSSRTRVVVQFDREPEFRWLLMRGPHRLVIDLPETDFRMDMPSLPKGMLTGVQHGGLGEGRARLIMSFDTAFEVKRVEIVANEEAPGFRLVTDLVAASERQFEAAMAEQIEATGSTQAQLKGSRVGKTGERKFRVVIDPGHGGIDTGAEGNSGTLEKTITLAFGLELKKKLEESGDLDVFLTRDHDLFLRLDERVRIARKHEADLFISIHADAIRWKNFRGATVYTVSDKASDAEAAAKAIRENLADEIGGIRIEEEHQEVADILADLIRRETQGFSIRFARSLIGELSGAIGMIPKNPHRFAGFKVLRAPDVPSVLLELGYLSNKDDETLLRDPEWRAKAAGGIAAAISYFSAARNKVGG